MDARQSRGSSVYQERLSSAHQGEQEVHGAGMVIGWGATHPWLCGRPLLPDGKGRPTGSVHHVVVVSHHHESHPG